jgi:hypothetical protein
MGRRCQKDGLDDPPARRRSLDLDDQPPEVADDTVADVDASDQRSSRLTEANPPGARHDPWWSRRHREGRRSHCPMLSQPDRVLDVILKAAASV